MKIKIVAGMWPHESKLFLNDQNVTPVVQEIQFDMKAGEVTTVKVTFIPEEIQIEGDSQLIASRLVEESEE